MKIVKYVVSIVLGISLIMPFSIDIKAANVGAFDSYLNEPSITEGTGYFTILLQNNTSGAYSIQVIQFYTSSSTNYDGVNNGDFVDIQLYDNKMTVYFNGNVDTVTRGTIFWWKGTSVEVANVTVSASATNATWTKSYSSYTIVGCQVFGNVGHVYNYLTTNHVYSVNWNGSEDYSDDIEELQNQLIGLNSNFSNLSLTLDDINGYVKTIKSNTSTIKTTLTNLYNITNEFFTNGIDSVLSKYFGQKEENVNDMNKSELDNKTEELNNIESEIVDKFENNISNIELNNDLFKGNDFVKTSTFIASQMTNIYNSNEYIKNLITFSMIIGLALTMIGIGLKR